MSAAPFCDEGNLRGAGVMTEVKQTFDLRPTLAPVPPSPPPLSTPTAHTRQRLLETALRLFSQGGYDKVSVRDIAESAQVNVSAVSYHFGGKSGLYRAALTEPLGSVSDDIPLFDQPHFSLRESLEGLYRSLLEPLTADPRAQQCVRLHLREMLDPTGVWNEQVQNDFRPAHEALLRVLQRHLKLSAVDDDLLYLSLALTGLALHVHLSRDVAHAVRPGLLEGSAAVNRWEQRLVEQALALVQAEALRRGSDREPEGA
ncbi:MAG: CerR family C-terminal domain-containing protein [Burkholderiaceae bacterium]|jgi:AcrR family transcriptional regulator